MNEINFIQIEVQPTYTGKIIKKGEIITRSTRHHYLQLEYTGNNGEPIIIVFSDETQSQITEIKNAKITYCLSDKK